MTKKIKHPGGEIIHFFNTSVDGTRIRMDKTTMDILNVKNIFCFYRFKFEFPKKHILLVPNDLFVQTRDFLGDNFDGFMSREHRYPKIKSNISSQGRVNFPDCFLRYIGVNSNKAPLVMLFVREEGIIEIYEYQVGKELI